MVRRISNPGWLNRLRQIQARQKQTLNQYNQAVRQHNHQVRQRVAKIKSAINAYNAAVRTYDQRVRANQQRLRIELSRMRASSSTRYVIYRQSVSRLAQSYSALEAHTPDGDSNDENYLLDLSEREAANSVDLLNVLERNAAAEDTTTVSSDLQSTQITDEIAVISRELDSRWKGALFSLNPANPEAARHFCTSVREIFTGVLELTAPDDVVAEAIEDCTYTDQGKVTRRSKMSYLIQRKGIENDALVAFADENIDNIVEPFRELNSGTHGVSGTMSVDALRAIKRRVEDSLLFLCQIAA